MSSSQSVVTGRIWTDHSTGQELITFNGQVTNMLQALIPVWLGFVASEAWTLVRLGIWHAYYRRTTQILSNKRVPHSLCQQRSWIIANSSGGLELAMKLLQQWWVWRQYMKRKGFSVFSANFPFWPILVGAFHFVFWTAAGILTLFLFFPNGNMSDQAIVSGDCGTVELLDINNVTEVSLNRVIANNHTNSAASYVERCYGKDRVLSQCSTFTQDSIPYEFNDTECFLANKSICLTKAATPIVIHTKLFSVSDALGVNAEPSHDIWVEKSTKCSPLTSQGRTEVVSYNETHDNNIYPNDTKLYRFYYGKIERSGNPNASISRNWTYEWSDWEPSYVFKYNINSFFYSLGPAGSVWTPDSTFWDPARGDADLSLLFINGDHVVYSYPNDDPTFQTGQSATEPILNINTTFYVPAYYINVISCIDQYQVCGSSHDNASCTGLTGSYGLAEKIFSIGLNDQQLATAQRITNATLYLNTQQVVDGRGGGSLLLDKTLAENFQYQKVPTDQWRREVLNWFAISLADLQQRILEFAAAKKDTVARASLRHPTSATLASQCHTQRIKLPSGYSNVSWLGLRIILAISIPLWSLGTIGEWVIEKLLAYRGCDDRRMEWLAQKPLGAQRLAYKTAGYGQWERENKDIPVWEYRAGESPPVLINENDAPALPPAP